MKNPTREEAGLVGSSLAKVTSPPLPMLSRPEKSGRSKEGRMRERNFSSVSESVSRHAYDNSSCTVFPSILRRDVIKIGKLNVQLFFRGKGLQLV